MFSHVWVRVVLVAAIAFAALLLVRMHRAEEQPAPMIKGTRTCSEIRAECGKGCLKSSHPDQCMRACGNNLQQCLSTGCWIGSDFRFCGLVKQ